MTSRLDRATEPARVMRRLQVTALIYGVVGAVGFSLRSLEQTVFLTLGAAVSIVSFRSLRALVGQLGTAEKGNPDERGRQRIWLRFPLLLLIPLVTLWLDSERTLALLVGFSVLPLALMTEGIYQIYASMTAGREHGS